MLIWTFENRRLKYKLKPSSRPIHIDFEEWEGGGGGGGGASFACKYELCTQAAVA